MIRETSLPRLQHHSPSLHSLVHHGEQVDPSGKYSTVNSQKSDRKARRSVQDTLILAEEQSNGIKVTHKFRLAQTFQHGNVWMSVKSEVMHIHLFS